MKKPRLLILLLIPALLLAGCRSKHKAAPEYRNIMGSIRETDAVELHRGERGGTMMRADVQELDTLNVVTTRSRPLYALLGLVFEGLLSINPVTGEIQGGVATEYSVINDGYSLLLKLDEKAVFSDGRPCTADDVLYSIEEIYMNPEVDSKTGDVLRIRERVISVHRVDRHTVRFDLPVPYRPFLHTLTTLRVLPRHILEPFIDEAGVDGFNREWGRVGSGTDNLIGTGPYMLQEVIPGKHIRLTRNPHYSPRRGYEQFEGLPYLDEIIEVLDMDSETKLLKFQIGELDFYDVRDIDIESGDIQLLAENQTEGSYGLYSAGQTLRGNHFLAFNQNPKTIRTELHALFSDRRFRKAVSHVIDRQRINEEIYQGFAFIDESPERDASPFYTKNPPAPYNPDEAKLLFEQLSLKDTDGDGFYNLPGGAAVSFTILTNEDNPFRVKMGEHITGTMRRAGLDVTFKPADYDLIVTKLLDTFEWEAVILGFEGSIEPNDASWIWESKGALHLWHPYQETPATPWEERIDILFSLGRTTWDREESLSYYHEYQNIIAREIPVMQIVVPAEIYGFREGFGNVIPSSATYNAIGLVPYLYKLHRRQRQ
jgi:peptide/nickel transport system substrate-binding protein